ncbi:hypothetical protein [Acidithiobacillus sp.]
MAETAETAEAVLPKNDDEVEDGRMDDTEIAESMEPNGNPSMRRVPYSGTQTSLSEKPPVQTSTDDPRPSNGYDIPSRRLSLLVEGRDYLKYRETFERVLFAEKLTPAQKDGKLLQLALVCLVERMDALSAETGEPFVKAEMLAG